VITKSSASLGATTREFWHQFSNPTENNLGKAILFMLVFAESLVCIFWIFTLSGLGAGYATMAAVPYAYLVVSYVSLWLFYRSKKFAYFIFTQLIMLLAMPFFMQWAIGGYEASSGIAIWAILSPIGALMILGTKQSTPWFILFLVLALFSWQFNYLFAGNAMPMPANIKSAFLLMNIIGVACILYAVTRYFQSQKERAMLALNLEQGRSEKLLLNILPQSIATRLKDNDMRIADGHDSVTIMFADIVDFTKLTDSMRPAELVEMLSQVFSRFDRLAEQYGLEKIKTIGDGYMVVGGAPLYREDHAVVIAQLALEMQEGLLAFNIQANRKLQMRIGMSSGAVVAGVIGTTKFAYDLWGDPVNMASRMEKTGIAGEIQMSESTYLLIKDYFNVKIRAAVAVKGKGEVTTYLLQSKIE
jgi:adenylate cyclase